MASPRGVIPTQTKGTSSDPNTSKKSKTQHDKETSVSVTQGSTPSLPGSGNKALPMDSFPGRGVALSQHLQNILKRGKTYVVKFANVPPQENDQGVEMFEIVGVNERAHETIKELERAKADKAFESPSEVTGDVESSPGIASGPTRSKRQIKTPKRLQDAHSVIPKKTFKAKETNKFKARDQENMILELPRITISNISKADLYIEVEIESELSVSPLELVEEDSGKSKYGFKISKSVNAKADTNVKENTTQEQIDIETKTVLEENPPPFLKDEASDANVNTKTDKSITSGKSPKRKSRQSSQNSPKKRSKKLSMSEKNNAKSMLKTKEKGKPDVIEPMTDEDHFDQVSLPETSENFDDTFEDIPANEEELVENGNNINVKAEQEADEKASQTEIDSKSVQLEQSQEGAAKSEVVRKRKKTVKEPGENSKPKRKYTKKSALKDDNVEDPKPKRKYTKRSAYNHDSTNYTLVTNDEGKRAFKCDICGVEMVFGGNMRDHIRSHTGEKPFECEVCGKTFGSNNNLKCHMVVHSDERPFVCDICGFAFKQKGLMKIHRSRHDPESSRFTCHMCGKSFYSSTEVKKHMSKHTGEKNYECQICHKRYSQDSALARHRFVHTENKPHKCQFCDMSFVRKEIYQRHLKKYHSNVNEDDKIKTELSQPSEIVIGIQDEASEAAEHLMDRETVYIQLDGTNYQIPYIEEDKGTNVLYQSMEIPVQQGEIIIVTETTASDLVKSIDYTHM